MRPSGIVSLPLLLLFSSLFSPTYVDAEPVQETISGRGARAIQAAVPQLEQRKLSVADYAKVTVWEYESSLIVLFGELDPSKGGRGPPNLPNFSVELDKGDFRVLRSQFDR